MPLGSILLLIVAVLVYFGLAHRVLDRMRLTDKAAVGLLLAMLIGGFINFTLLSRPVELIVNLGGGVVPIAIAGYLIGTADEAAEKVRALVGMAVTGAAIWAFSKIIPPEPTDNFLMDPTYVFSAVAGVVGYLAGRSRRAAFVSGTMGVVIADFIQFGSLLVRGIPGRTWVGGAGAFDTVVIAGVLAVVLAEVVGEARERMAAAEKAEDRKGPGDGRGDANE